MVAYQLKITLLSETTFGRGDGQAGVVDMEVQHDDMGCPYWSGRAIKGILVNECADILFAIGDENDSAEWLAAAKALFGQPGSAANDQGCLSIGEAQLPDDLRAFLGWQLQQRQSKSYSGANDTQKRVSDKQQRERFRKELLASLTTVRSQTALEEDGAAKEHSLRANRVLLPGLILIARLRATDDLKAKEKGLLSACVKAVHASGTGRNRGKGDVRLQILDESGKDLTGDWFTIFKGGLQ